MKTAFVVRMTTCQKGSGSSFETAELGAFSSAESILSAVSEMKEKGTGDIWTRKLNSQGDKNVKYWIQPFETRMTQRPWFQSCLRVWPWTCLFERAWPRPPCSRSRQRLGSLGARHAVIICCMQSLPCFTFVYRSLLNWFGSRVDRKLIAEWFHVGIDFAWFCIIFYGGWQRGAQLLWHRYFFRGWIVSFSEMLSDVVFLQLGADGQNSCR